VVDRTGAQLQRLAKFLQQKQPFFQQLQPEVVHDVSTSMLISTCNPSWAVNEMCRTHVMLQVARFLLYDHIKAGTILMKQGDKGDHMYIILSGQANIHIANSTLECWQSLCQAMQHREPLQTQAAVIALYRLKAALSNSPAQQNCQGIHRCKSSKVSSIRCMPDIMILSCSQEVKTNAKLMQ